MLCVVLRYYRSEPYDPYLPRGGSSSNPPGGGNPKTAAIQAQIDDTVGIMRDNITKVAERGERLDQLQDKTGMFPPFPSNDCAGTGCSAYGVNPRYSFTATDNLAISAQGFRRGADRVRKV